jgi:predicted dehydrogenase
VAVVRFQNGGMGTIFVSNSQKPGIYAKVHIHGDNGATVGVQPEGGAMFIAGMTSILEPPLNDLWTIPGEEGLLADWQQADREAFARVDPTTHYIGLQIHDFVRAILDDRAPAVTGEDGRVTVELFTAIYRSQRDGRPVKFPVSAADAADDFDGRMTGR